MTLRCQVGTLQQKVAELSGGGGGGGPVEWADVLNKPSAYPPESHTHGQYEQSANKGVANGYASLGADGKVPSAQLPASQGGSGLTFLSVSLGGYVLCTNIGASYDAVNPTKGLGIAVVDFTGCTSIRFDARVQKVGSGTQSWQLWNETDGLEIAVLNDTQGAGLHELTTTITTNLPTGEKLVRIRGKSTTSADDPIFYGAALKIDY